MVEYFFRDGGSRGGAPEQRRGEGVRVGVQTDHPRTWVCLGDHFSVSFWLCRRTETGQALTCTQVCGAVPMQVLCAGAHSLKRRWLLQVEFTSISRNATCRLADQQVLMVTLFPSALQLLPECSRTPINKPHTLTN